MITEIDPSLIQHSEYDIEVDDSDNIELKSANKLVIIPVLENGELELRRNKQTLLLLPIKAIEKVVTIPIQEANLKRENGSILKIIFSDDNSSDKSITFNVKNKRHTPRIQQQILLLKEAAQNDSVRKAIISSLNPKLCNLCLENDFAVNFSSKGKLRLGCFEKEYGKILLQTEKPIAEYHGGHKDYNPTGIFGKHSVAGMAYLTENHFIFAKDDKELTKKWELIIPLDSVILNWDLEEKQREKNIKWEGTTLYTFGFGSGFVREEKKSEHLIIPYIDRDGRSQEPEFNLPSFIRKWAADLYRMVVKAKMSLSQQKIFKDNNRTIQTHADCFNCNREFEIYNLNICGHCILSFCDVCINNHSINRELEFDPKYLGGHKLYPKPMDTRIYVFSDRIEVNELNLRIPYTSIGNIENADEKKITAKRMLLAGWFAFAWRKKDIFTIIEYTDGFNQKQVLIFDFGKRKIEEAQQKIYDRMLASQFAKERLLDPKKLEDNNTKVASFLEDNTTVFNKKTESKSEIIFNNTSPLPGISQLNETDKDNTNPLHILKVRFAKGEITKEQYEEMRKLLES